MKKKKIELSKKLFLQKGIISILNRDQESDVVGGGQTDPITYCGTGCPTMFNCETSPSAIPNCCAVNTATCTQSVAPNVCSRPTVLCP